MAYIGKTPLVGNFQICDAISVVNNQAAYTMQVAGVNVIPESSNNIICSLGGIIQKPGSSFTVSGSTITFSQNLVTGDVIDFIQILGSVLDIGTPSDGTVTESKIGSNAVTSAKMFSGFANGITMADQFRLTADLANPGAADITANLERVDTNGFAKIGTGMTESSGIFTFPSTGLFLVRFMATVFYDNDYMGIEIFVSTDGSNFVSAAMSNGGTTTVNGFFTLSGECFINVTNTSNFKVKFKTNSMTASTIEGDTDQTRTGFTFIRLGDSQ